MKHISRLNISYLFCYFKTHGKAAVDVAVSEKWREGTVQERLKHALVKVNTIILSGYKIVEYLSYSHKCPLF